MKNAALFAFALLLAAAPLAPSAFAAEDPSATTAEPMKSKPAKHKHHTQKHERHAQSLRVHKIHKAG